jgi:hypothetical protein
MEWYVAKLVFNIICGDKHAIQFDEQLRLIAADGTAMAFRKAQKIGREEEETFLNAQQQLVHWKFIDVAELYQLRTLTDGAELYASTKEENEPCNYINIVHHKAANLRESSLNQGIAVS